MADERTTNYQINGYLPRTIIDWYHNSEADTVHRITELNGVLACVDASGFTALTKKLSEKNAGGAEHLTTILNSFFDTLCGAVFCHGGDVLKFAGDALWAYFPPTFDSGRFLADALQGMKEINSSEKLLSESPLTVHIGAESGTFVLTSLGIESMRLEAEPHGRLVQTVYDLCGVAGENDMVIGDALAKQSDKQILGEKLSASCFRVIPGERTKNKPVDHTPKHLSSSISARYLASYIPSELFTRLRSTDSENHLNSEHRSVTVLFANCDLVSPNCTLTEKEEIAELNGKIIQAFTLIRDLGGTIARIDPFEPGHKLLVLFGAPRKQADDELRALSCARELLALGDESFKIRVGLSLGSLFCGDVGAKERREYTVMGEAANTAARLMSKSAWGELLLDDALRDKLPPGVKTEPLFFALKGMGDNVRCHKLTHITEATTAERKDVEIIGLNSEFARLNDSWQKVQSGQSRTLAIIGATGTGKTALCQMFAYKTTISKNAFLACSQSLLFGPGWLAKKIIEILADREDLNTPGQYADYIEALVGKRWMPLLSEILGTAIPDNKWTTGLSSELRLSKTRELFRTVVCRLTDTPTTVICDDYDKADEFSKQLVTALIEERMPVPFLLVVVGRERLFDLTDENKLVERLEVQSPSSELWWQYFDEHFEDGKREREFFQKLLSTTQRNPYCVMDFLRRSLERDYLHPSSATGKWELMDSSADIKLPESVNDVNLEQFDCLAESQRQLLKIASVSGARFSNSAVSEIAGEDANKTLAVFELLKAVGLLSGQKGDDQFTFTHISMSEAIYSCLSLADKKRLHKAFACIGERQRPSATPAVLAHHFFLAECPKPAFTFSLRAAIAATKAFSLTEASSHFKRCRDALRLRKEMEIPPDELFAYFREYTKSLISEGKYPEAFRVAREWRRTANHRHVVDQSVAPVLETAKTVFKQSKYQRSRKIIDILLRSEFVAQNPDVRSMALTILAEIERRTGNFRGARILCQQAIELASNEETGAILTDAYNKLGLALWGEGDLAGAARQFEDSLKLAGHDNSMYARAQTTNNLAIVHWELGDFNTSAKLLDESSSIFEEIGDRRNEAYSAGNLASLYRISGALDSSEKLFLRADAIFRRLKDEHAHQYTMGNLGDLDLVRGRFENAEAKFTLARTFAQKVGDAELEAECNVRFGDLAFFRREMTEAEKLYLTASDKAKSIGSVEYHLRASLGLARLNIYRRDNNTANNYIEEVITAAKESRSILFEREAEFLRGEQHRISENYHSACTCYQTVLDYALSQNVFELTLKSAVRITEVDKERYEYAQGIILSLANDFVSKNNRDSWAELINSGYFSFFKNTIDNVLASRGIEKQSTPSNTL